MRDQGWVWGWSHTVELFSRLASDGGVDTWEEGGGGDEDEGQH